MTDRYFGCPYGRPMRNQNTWYRRARHHAWDMLPDRTKAALIDARTTARAKRRHRKLQRAYRHLAHVLIQRKRAQHTA